MAASLASQFEVEIRPRLERIGFVRAYDRYYSIPISEGRRGNRRLRSG